MQTKRVFILGAGFSKQAGMPLATELTDLILEKFKEYGQTEMLAWFDDLKRRIDWLEKASGKKSGGVNIEQVFDLAWFDAELWKMEQHLCALGRTCGDTPWQASEDIEAWLSHMENDLIDAIWDSQKQAQQNLDSISTFSKNLQAEDAVLTFNYDTLLENSLSHRSKAWWYGFAREGGPGTKILKMHGSINWKMAPRDTSEKDDLLFRKQDINVTKHNAPPPDEVEYKYDLACVTDDKVDRFIGNRDLQWAERYSYVGIAGLGTYKRLHLLPGSGEVWFNAIRALREAQEIYIIGFSLSPFDKMARLHFGGVMCGRAEKNNFPQKVVLIDPKACDLKANFAPIFGPHVPMIVRHQKAEEVQWPELLGG